MNSTVEINAGEIKVKLSAPVKGKVSFAELGLTNEDLFIESGNLRLVFDFEGIGEHNYYQVPTIEIFYKENIGEIHWLCDFNENTIVDKYDNHGKSSVILMDRKKIAGLEHHHQNKLIVHGDFPEAAHIVAEDSFIHLFN